MRVHASLCITTTNKPQHKEEIDGPSSSVYVPSDPVISLCLSHSMLSILRNLLEKICGRFLSAGVQDF